MQWLGFSSGESKQQPDSIASALGVVPGAASETQGAGALVHAVVDALYIQALAWVLV